MIMQNHEPPYNRCKSCLYWRETWRNDGLFCCHYAVYTGKLRSKTETDCKSYKRKSSKGGDQKRGIQKQIAIDLMQKGNRNK